MSQGILLESPPKKRDVAGLPYFDGRRLAVVLNNGGSCLVLRGRARYVDDFEGGTLRIEVDNGSQSEEGRPVFVIREDDWRGRFAPDLEYGCEFQLRLDVDSVPNPARVC